MFVIGKHCPSSNVKVSTMWGLKHKKYNTHLFVQKLDTCDFWKKTKTIKPGKDGCTSWLSKDYVNHWMYLLNSLDVRLGMQTVW